VAEGQQFFGCKSGGYSLVFLKKVAVEFGDRVFG